MEIDSHMPEDRMDRAKNELRSKSSNRLRYEAEVQFLRRQNGDLEQIRERLGLSRRKMCQLLLVDPSAWTRWTGPGGEAPPHIYRALDWYLSIMEKDPEYRRLAQRFAEWLNHEKDYDARLRSLEGLLEGRLQAATPKTLGWRDFLAPILAFFAGILLVLLSFRRP